MIDIWHILALAGLLLLSAIFSLLETAYTSLTPGQISSLAEKKGKRGKMVRRLSERWDMLLTTLLIGNNLANLLVSALTTALTIRIFGNAYIGVSTGLLTITVLIFCEVSPKQIAIVANETFCLTSAPAIIVLTWIFRPLIWLIGTFSRLITKILVGNTKRTLTLDHILHHIKAAQDQGVVESYEEEMVRKVFRINDKPVESIMTHRTDMYTVEERNTVREALDGLLKMGFSRAPMVQSGTEHVTGIISLNSLASVITDSGDQPVKKFATSPYLVPGTLKAYQLFFTLKQKSIHMAVVLDEYGGLHGVVTLEDVIEEIFGIHFNDIRPDEMGTWIIQGDADFYRVSDVLGLHLEHDSRTHTIGGYLLEKMDKLPYPGQEINLSEGLYTIIETFNKRIVSVRFIPSEKQP